MGCICRRPMTSTIRLLRLVRSKDVVLSSRGGRSPFNRKTSEQRIRRNIRRRPLGLGCELYLTAGKERSYGRHEVYRNGCSQGLDLDRGAELVGQAGDGMRHRNQGDYDSRVRAWTAWEFASDV